MRRRCYNYTQLLGETEARAMFNASAKAVKTIVRPAQRSKAVLSSGFGNAARYFGVLRFYFYAYFFRQKAV